MEKEITVIAGPCAVESREQILEIADHVKEAGASYLRAMIYKPRTNPDSFQGIGEQGLDWIVEARDQTGLCLVTEVLDQRNVERVAQHIDVLQIGSRNMQNYALLKEVGRVMAKLPDKYVLLKRGMCAKVEEIKGAIDYLVFEGVNREHVWFCERGIQPAYNSCRNTFDVNIIPIMQQLGCAGKVIADPSHSTGRPELVIPIARAAIAAGADGLEVEVHNNPACALCDGPQALLPEQFNELMKWTRKYISMDW